MYRQFNQWLKAKQKPTLRSCIIVVGRGLAGKGHIAFRNIEGLNTSKTSHVYNNEITRKSDWGIQSPLQVVLLVRKNKQCVVELCDFTLSGGGRQVL